MSHVSRPAVPAPRERPPGPSTESPADDGLTVAPSQPRPGLLRLRVLGDLDRHSAPRCARILVGSIDAVAAERDTRGAQARVVCDLTDVDVLDTSGAAALSEADVHARDRDVEFVVLAGEGHPTLIDVQPADGRHPFPG